ncbi:MAG TPA: LysM peptidoglycan-binding domain-containing protein [Opitutaceae bacterium]|nr:LysM peptidoglycan-binding domain-containing protein [Opitutaceae bacterium]
MKILKIFGLVVGIHVLAFMFVFAIPGCRSSTRHSPPPPQAVQAETQPVRMAAPSPVSDLSAPAGTNAPASSPSYAANPVSSPSGGAAASSSLAPATVSFDSGGTSSSGLRANPTRPGTPVASALKAPAPEVTPATTQVVVNGDTLWKIARQHHITIKELAAANNLNPETPVRPGQKLIIPGKAQPTSTSAPNLAPHPTDTLTYEVRSGDSLALIAKRAGTTTATIKQLNHLRSDMVRVGQKLTLPSGNAAAAALAASSNAPEGDTFAGPAAAKSANGSGVHHVVKSGETLGQIARHYGVSRRELAVANNIVDPLKLRPGQDLVIPNAKAPAPANQHNDMNTPAAAPTEQAPAPETSSPIAPATDSSANPVASPISGESGPPVIQVQENNNPVAAPK